MTRQVAPLDAAEVTAWLTRVAQTIDRALRDAARAEALGALRDEHAGTTRLGLPVLAQLALLADCLRVAHLAILADGKTEPEELGRVADLVRVAASKYFFALPRYEAFEDGAPSAAEVVRFLRHHREDDGPFGFARPDAWPGLALARLVERTTRNVSALREHERMLVRIMDEVFGERATDVERVARRRLRELFEEPPAPGADPRVLAFCRSDGPEVFTSIAHASHIHERDPFDIETIHAEARDRFYQQVDRATTPEHAQHGQGRILLVLGESGSGKTHLLRALRAQVHGRRLGYVGYLQMTPETDDPARYALRSLVDSLERPYDPPALSESGLMYLSDGLVEARDVVPAGDLERLRGAELDPEQLEHLVGTLVDRVVRSEGLERLETDLVQALLLLQRRDAAVQRRVVRFLRCESLNSYDRRLLGGIGGRDRPEDPIRTIQQLANLMHELQLAALVLVIDQIEELIPDGRTATRLQQALDCLRAIAEGVPSAVVVVACLDDVYDAVRTRLSSPLVDRLERDPPIRLASRRQPEEIEQMLIRRLEFLYAAFDVAWREDDPLFPFTPAQIQAVSQLRTRDCLGKFREYHNACIAARAIVDPASVAAPAKPTPARAPVTPPAPPVTAAPPVTVAPPAIAARSAAPLPVATVAPPPSPAPAQPPPAQPPPAQPPPAQPPPALDKLWRETLDGVDLPDDGQILELVADALRGAAIELDLALTIERDGPQRLVVEGKQLRRRMLTLCNRAPQGGRLGAQLDELRHAAVKAGVVPVALRSSDFSFQPKSRISQQVGEIAAASGLTVVLGEEQLRFAAAACALAKSRPAEFTAWRRAKLPTAELPFVREILERDRILERVELAEVDEPPASLPGAPAAAATTRPAPATSAARPQPEPPARPSAPVLTFDPQAVRLGVVDSMRADPILLPLEDIKTHVAFLGGTGSGKTTAALSVVEQLLERGVSVLLVDRKGDLARYVSDTWWTTPALTPEASARKAALRARIELALYTPGNPQGRPLRLPLVPALDDATPHDREQLARFAAGGLGAMMGYSASAAHRAKASILQCAILLHAAERDVTLDVLLDTISRPDPELLHAVGSLQRHFAGLTEDLQTLAIQRGSLVSGDGDALDVAALLPPPGGRARLSIINTAALTEVAVLQFWISRLLVELGRLGRKRPSATLQAAAFFDEADAYVPATSAPPTKEPMFDLLRRSRSTGIGVLLATQNPGDFDYKARDNIQTWLLGKVTQDRAIEKMRHLIASYPDVGPRLASQRTGCFFVLSGTTKRELKADRSLMETVQLSEAEVAELARTTRQACM